MLATWKSYQHGNLYWILSLVLPDSTGFINPHWWKYCRRFLLVSNTLPGFPSLGEKHCLLWVKAFIQSKQYFSPREGNPGNVLLTSRKCLQNFYQCINGLDGLNGFNSFNSLTTSMTLIGSLSLKIEQFWQPQKTAASFGPNNLIHML